MIRKAPNLSTINCASNGRAISERGAALVTSVFILGMLGRDRRLLFSPS